MDAGALDGEARSQLRLTTAGDTIVIEVHGILDATAVRTIDDAASSAVATDWAKVRVDLGNMAGYTDGGVEAFATFQARFPPGAGRRVIYQASSQVGQEALLAAYGRAS